MSAILDVKSLLTPLVAALLWGTAACHAQTAGSALARMVRSGTVNVGYIPTPGTFAFRDASGNTVGYSIDVCMKVVEGIARPLAGQTCAGIFGRWRRRSVSRC